MKQQDLVSGLVDDFFAKANIQKSAADQTNPQGAGSEELKKKKTGTEIQEVSADNTLAAEKDRGAEMEADLKDSETGAVKGYAQLAADDGAQVSETDAVVHPQDNPQSPQQVDADESVKMEGDNVKVTDVTTSHAAPSEIAKVARANRLGQTLLAIVAEGKFEEDEPIQKEAAAAPKAEEAPATDAPVAEDAIQKLASSDIDPEVAEMFLAYSAGFERGMQKKAEDINEVVESGLAPDEDQAAALLDTAAVQNPEAVLPEEAQPEAALSADDTAALDTLADQLDAAGVTPEELQEAQGAIEQIKAETGASDEEIIAMLEEEAAASEAAPAEAPIEEAPVAPIEEEPMPKVASDRKSDLLAALQEIQAQG